MIISASRRTDIPAYYSDWLFNRLKEGFVLVRNPMNFHQVRRVDLSPDAVDAIVFWTKNPSAMIRRLDELRDYMYYFQFTITPYGADIEPNLPPDMVSVFRDISYKIGQDRIIWRYDPILLNAKYTADYHIRAFHDIAGRLHGYTQRVIISFIDINYKNVKNNFKMLGLIDTSEEARKKLACELSSIARNFGLSIYACAEKSDLQDCGIQRAACIDGVLLSKLLARDLSVKKDKNQRAECGCMPSVDIGMYNSCANGCLYCYANYNKSTIARNVAAHNPQSTMLIDS